MTTPVIGILVQPPSRFPSPKPVAVVSLRRLQLSWRPCDRYRMNVPGRTRFIPVRTVLSPAELRGVSVEAIPYQTDPEAKRVPPLKDLLTKQPEPTSLRRCRTGLIRTERGQSGW